MAKINHEKQSKSHQWRNNQLAMAALNIGENGVAKAANESERQPAAMAGSQRQRRKSAISVAAA